jgi:hypothetical protein
MDGLSLCERHIKFFDSVMLFVDFWEKKSDKLNLRFYLSAYPSETKAVFHFSESQDQEHVNSFKLHLLRHFQSQQLTSSIVYEDSKIEVFMIED